MKKFVLAVAMALTLVACTGGGQDPAEIDKITWSIVQSPNTGICYEVAAWYGYGLITDYQGFAGMAEVPCP